MKCRYCSWTGPFKSSGSHMAAKHRRILLKNLKKARSASSRRKASATRTRNRSVQAGESLPRKGSVHRGRKREVHVTEEAIRAGDVTIIIRRD